MILPTLLQTIVNYIKRNDSKKNYIRYWMDKKTQTQIAKELGVTAPYVCRLVKQFNEEKQK